MDAGLGVMLFMGVVLKIPVGFAVWIIWKALQAEPDPVEGEGGSGDRNHRQFRRDPQRPRGPRRGPHAPDSLPLPCPADDGQIRVARGTRPSESREPVR